MFTVYLVYVCFICFIIVSSSCFSCSKDINPIDLFIGLAHSLFSKEKTVLQRTPTYKQMSLTKVLFSVSSSNFDKQLFFANGLMLV